MPFHCYGENSFTFLLFHALAHGAGDGEWVRDCFLAQLQPFRPGRAANEQRQGFRQVAAKDISVWLFPNFGKSSGFGEPDALVLAGNYTFWIEAETYVDFEKRRTNARSSIRQLLRFRQLARAIASGVRTRGAGTKDRHLAITGWTFDGFGRPKADSILRVKAHEPFDAVRVAVRRSVQAGRDQYVLLSYASPVHVSQKGRSLVESSIKEHFDELHIASGVLPGPPPERPMADQFWYTYWSGPIKHAFTERKIPDPLTADVYCPIKG